MQLSIHCKCREVSVSAHISLRFIATLEWCLARRRKRFLNEILDFCCMSIICTSSTFFCIPASSCLMVSFQRIHTPTEVHPLPKDFAHDLTNLSPSLPAVGVAPFLNEASASSHALPAPKPKPTHTGHARRLKRRTENMTPKERPRLERIRSEEIA